MKGKWHYAAALLFLLALLYDFFLWGGLARTPTLGRVMSDVTTRELAWGGVYLRVGSRLVDLTGLRNTAAAHASETFRQIEPKLLAQPEVAMETIVEEMPFSVTLVTTGCLPACQRSERCSPLT